MSHARNVVQGLRLAIHATSGVEIAVCSCDVTDCGTARSGNLIPSSYMLQDARGSGVLDC
jgi:hypothetical protein